MLREATYTCPRTMFFNIQVIFILHMCTENEMLGIEDCPERILSQKQLQ